MFETLTAVWHWISLGLIIVVVLALIFLSRPVRVGIRGLAFIVNLSTSYGPRARAGRREIVVSGITYGCGNREIVSDLYRPADGRRHSSVILAHGAVEQGKDDRAMKFAGETLARAGIVALVPQLDNLRRFRLHHDDLRALIAGLQYLSRQTFSNGRIGMFGVCLSAPLVVLAATDPAVGRKLAVIASWGGFYNINDWLQDIIRGQYIDGGEVKPWKPRPILVEECRKWLIELLPDAADRGHVSQMLAAKDARDVKLSPSGRAMYELLSNRDPDEVPALWAKLDPRLQQALDSLSPHKRIDQLRTKIALIHSVNDDVVPWVESVRLANAVKAEYRIYFKVFQQFYHASIEDLLRARISKLGSVISEILEFYKFVYRILYQL